MNPVKLFISYAHDDEEYKDQLIRQLSGLIRRGLIEEWNDRKIAPGQEWDNSIKNALAVADIVLFLISSDFMASDYIYEEEIKQAFKRYEQDQVILVPILIRACDFSSSKLSDFPVLPKNKAPTRSWDNRDEAWLDVIEGIKALILPEGEPSPPSTLDTTTPPSAEVASSKAILNDYHRFTCDRVPHNDMFKTIFKNKKGQQTQFYYLYGVDMQSHLGFFNRIAYDLEGRLQDYLGNSVAQNRRALKIELSFEESDVLEHYKENILKSLFASFCIPVDDHEPLLKKNLSFAYQKSPTLKGLNANDYVCVFISISEYDWDPELTPQATRWFIHDFCEGDLSEEMPTFLFFFAIQYEEEDVEIREEVEAIVKESKSIEAIPELSMVSKGHIDKWLQKYRSVAPSTPERKALLKFHFGRERQFYMENVELALQKIIDEYNQS